MAASSTQLANRTVDPGYVRAAATGLLLLALYWLTASGLFHSVDEHSVFAAGRNLAVNAAPNQTDLYWGEDYIDLAQRGLDGELYSKYGVGHSLLIAGVLLLAQLIPGAGYVSSAMLLNGLATALTGVALVLAAGRLGYSDRTSVSLGLIYGLATFAWVYAKTMFSDPLVALGWIVAILLLIGVVSWRRALLVGAALACTVAIRPALVVVAPLFTLPLWRGPLRQTAGRLAAFGLPLVAVVAALLAFNQWRFGDPFQFGYSERFDGPLLVGLAGLLASLDRSILLFALPLLLLPWGLAPSLRHHRTLTCTILAIAVGCLLLYSAWPVFWGGPVWGPRYLLPTVPLLMLLLAPVVEDAWHDNGWKRWALLILAGISVAIELRAVLWNPLTETQTLGQRYPLWLLRPRAAWLDLAWLRSGNWIAILLCLGLAALALAALLRARRRLLAAALAATLLATLLLWSWLGASTRQINQHPAYTEVLARLKEMQRPGDALVLNPAPHQDGLSELIWFWNQPQANLPLYGLVRQPIDQATQFVPSLDRVLRGHPRVWLLTEGVAPGDLASTTEHHLVDSAQIAASQWLTDGFRLTLFEAPRPATTRGAPNVRLGDAAILEQWDMAWPGAIPNSVQVTLRWQPLASTPASLHSFVQVLDDEGNLVAAWDGVPAAGFAPTTKWRHGEPVQERMALTLPAVLPPGDLRLIAGLYDPSTGQRLMTAAGHDFVELASLKRQG